MPSTRRAFVLAAVTGLAGCTAMPSGSGPADSPDPKEPTAEPTDSDGPTPNHDDGCTSGFHVALQAFAPSDDLPIAVENETERAVVDAAIDGGTTRDTYGEATFDDGVVRHDGAYYWLDVSSAGTESVTAYLFDISWENGRTAPDDATLFTYEELPESDREAIRFLVPDGEGEEDMGHPTQGFSGRERPVPYPEGGEDSTLLPADTVWVRYEDREYRVTTGARTTTDRRRYRYTAERVAASRDELRAWAAERFLVDLSLSDDQRALLDAASSHYYEECAPASVALAGIRSQLPEDGRLPNAEGWYVNVDGDRHRLEILQWVE